MQDEQLVELLGRLYLQLCIGAARKRVFALRAERDGGSALALLFIALAVSEESQSRRLLYLLRGTVAGSVTNSQEVLDKELPLLLQRYKDLSEEAKADGSGVAWHLSEQEMRVGRKNDSLLRKISTATKPAKVYQVCSFCGYINENEAPKKCPICQAPQRRFTTVK